MDIAKHAQDVSKSLIMRKGWRGVRLNRDETQEVANLLYNVHAEICNLRDEKKQAEASRDEWKERCIKKSDKKSEQIERLKEIITIMRRETEKIGHALTTIKSFGNRYLDCGTELKDGWCPECPPF